MLGVCLVASRLVLTLPGLDLIAVHQLFLSAAVHYRHVATVHQAQTQYCNPSGITAKVSDLWTMCVHILAPNVILIWWWHYLLHRNYNLQSVMIITKLKCIKKLIGT